MAKWFMGNVHCHTNNSDGDSSPAFVAKVYKDAGFDFLVITDHNHFTLPAETGPADPKFCVIPGSEYTGLEEGLAHVNGIGLSAPFAPTKIKGMVKALQEGVDQVLAQNAVAMLNHPNWRWSWGAKEMAQVKGAHLFELYAGAYTSNNEGSPGRPGSEAMWDELLSQGIRIWGAGSDDCHKFQPPLDPFKDPPCSAWTVVQAEELSAASLVASLKAGKLYATTRVLLESVESDRQGLSIRIKPWDEIQYVTTFIGKGGKELGKVEGLDPAYRFKGNEGYVRARINCSDRHMAWTQPVFLG